MAKGNHSCRNYPSAQAHYCPSDLTIAVTSLRDLPSYDHSDVQAIKDRIDEYFDYCQSYGLRPGIELLCSFLGVSRQTLCDWQRKGGERGELIDRTKQLLAAIIEQMGFTGQINPTTLIWWQKNLYGYSDTVTLDTVVSHNDPLLQQLPSKEEILKRLPEND